MRAVFRDKSPRCPTCAKATLEVSEFNQRNAVVADLAESFAAELFSHLVTSSRTLSDNFFVKRKVECRQLELQGATAADMAILNRNLDGPVPIETIKCLFEIKMGIIWNWSVSDRSQPIADYDTHFGRPSISRTDSILKAIGKAAIVRSCPGSERIPFIVVANTPPPPNYRDKVDGTVRAGLIQKWISLTPNPLIVEPEISTDRRNPRRTIGFQRIDDVNELRDLLTKTLTREWRYIGAMVEAQKIGDLIKALDLSQPSEQIGYEFLKRLPSASTLSEL
jgi:hypothetical protein